MTKTKSQIVSTPDTLGGAWRIDGTRIPVALFLRFLRTDETMKQIRRDYPHLTKRQILTAIEWLEEKVGYD